MNTSPPVDPASAQLIAMEAEIQAGRIDAAVAALKRFHAANPTDVRALLIDALIARARKDTKRELIALHRATTAAPRWARAFMETAITLSREGRHPEALTAVEAAVDLAPGERPPLQVAINLAHAAGHAQVSLDYLKKAHALWPDDVEFERQLGSVLTNLHRYEEAETLWRGLLARHPHDSVAQINFAMALLGMQRREEAVALLENALASNHDNDTIRFLLASARGETPPSQPDSFVQGLFDGYASHFDSHLVGALKYGVPRRIAQLVHARDGKDLRKDILDLGCGTGLVGVYLGANRGSLTGVDLSARMLEQARRHPIYTRLEQANLMDVLRDAAPESFDYVIAADVFIYVGALDAVIPACHRVLRRGGALVFSCESAQDSEGALVLRPSNRYANSRASIQALCAQAGFARCTLESIDVRLENNVPIPGFIGIAEK
jgi:predicted TPR repeat methyltransferase